MVIGIVDVYIVVIDVVVVACICIALGFASVCKHSRPQLRNAQDLFVFNSNYDRLQIPNHDRAHITFQSSVALSI